MARMWRALAQSVAGTYGVYLLEFISVATISRILTPREIGVFSLSVALVLIAQEVRNFGVGAFIIRERNLTDAGIRAATAVAFLTCYALAVLFWLGAPHIADLYDEPGLGQILGIVAFTFLLQPFAIPVRAFLQRQMAFGTIIRVAWLTSLSRVTTTVCLALLGYSYLSMAWGILVGMVVEAGLLQLHKPAAVPRWPSLRGISKIIRFGLWVTLSGIVNRLIRHLPELAVGKMISFTAVGYLSRGESIADLYDRAVTRAVMPVFLPHISSLLDQPHAFGAGFAKAFSCQLALAALFFTSAFWNIELIILILFGDQWGEATPVARVLCLWGTLLALTPVCRNTAVALGEVKALFRVDILTLFWVLALVAGAVWYGVVAVAFAAIGGLLLANARSTVIVLKACPEARAPFFRALRSTLVVIVVTTGVTSVIYLLLEPHTGAFVRAAGTSLVALGVWVGMIRITAHPLNSELDKVMARLGNKIRRRDRTRSSN